MSEKCSFGFSERFVEKIIHDSDRIPTTDRRSKSEVVDGWVLVGGSVAVVDWPGPYFRDAV
jgi:hypothetical protein